MKNMNNDLISRNDAIDAFNIPTRIIDLTDVIKILSSLPPAQQWIPCTERLPENRRESYWVCTDTGYQCECRWTNNVYGICESDKWGWSIFDVPKYTTVAAWMSLPNPYKEEEKI